MLDVHFEQQQVIRYREAGASSKEVESVLADRLYELGLVKETFKDAVLERECTFPTGLNLGTPNVAIPHCDAEHVLENSIAVAIISKGASWQQMDDPDESCQVQLAIMLALKDSHSQLTTLQKVIALVQDKELVHSLLSSEDDEFIAQEIKARLFA